MTLSRRRKNGAGFSGLGVLIVLWLIFGRSGLTGLAIGGLIALSLIAVLSITAWALVFGRSHSSRSSKDEKKSYQVPPAARPMSTVRKSSNGGSVRKAEEHPGDLPTSVSVPAKKSYGPEIDPILEEGNRALSEMGRLYLSIKDPEVRSKINQIMHITDKITQDAIEDPSDIPQIKKFMNYYLPTTIKLLNAYDRMSAQGIEGENLNRSMKNINEMLDAAIVAYKRRLDSLFANQALDIETDIQVMNTLLAREGLTGEKDFQISPAPGSASNGGSAVQTLPE